MITFYRKVFPFLLGLAFACGEEPDHLVVGDFDAPDVDGKADAAAPITFDIEVPAGGARTFEFSSTAFGMNLLIEPLVSADPQPHAVTFYNDDLITRGADRYRRSAATEHHIVAPPELMQLRNHRHFYLLQVSNEGAAPLHARVTIDHYPYHPCNETRELRLGSDLDAVARCNRVIETAASGVNEPLDNADICVARGTFTRDSLFISAGDRFLEFDGRLAFQSGSQHPREDILQQSLWMDYDDDGSHVFEDDEHLEVFRVHRGRNSSGEEADVEHLLSYDKSSQTLEVLRRAKKTGWFQRWKTEHHYVLGCEAP